MPQHSRVVLLSTDAAHDRLRSSGACRAVRRDDALLHLSFDRLTPSDATPLDRELSIHLSSRELLRDAPVVALWVSERRGDLPQFLALLRECGRRMRGSLQADRRPLPLSACVVVCTHGIGTEDAKAIRELTAWRDGRSQDGDPLDAALPTRVPTYLMGDRTRVDVAGRDWSATEIWPAAVSRLLASLTAAPRRTPGLRAWRSIAVELGTEEAATLERMTLSVVRRTLVADAGAGGGITDAGSKSAGHDPDLTPTEPPHDRVNSSDCPAHALDAPAARMPVHPPVPDFWSISPDQDGSLTTVDGGASRHATARLDQTAPSCKWIVRKSDRGAQFMEERFARVTEGLRTQHGPRSILDRVWRAIHRTPLHLPWFASGGFVRAPRTPQASLVTAQMKAWREITELDREAAVEFDCTRAQAAELDVARSHFLSLPWRIMCMTSAALWSAAAIGVGTGLLGGTVTLAVGAGAAVSALLTGMVLLALELRAGSRARMELERTARFAENAAARAFHQRVMLGAEGELLQRSSAWMQSATKVRESAARLLALRQVALDNATRATTRADRLGAESRAREYSESTTVRGDATTAVAQIGTEVHRDQELRANELRAEFDDWWTRTLRELDPIGVGSIPAHALRPLLEERLEEVRMRVRLDVLGRFESAAAESWCARAQPEVLARFGSSADLAGLSARTDLSRNEARATVVLAISPSPAARRMLADAARSASFGRETVTEVTVASDDWCGMGLLLEEIDVRLEHLANDEIRIREGRAPGGTA